MRPPMHMPPRSPHPLYYLGINCFCIFLSSFVQERVDEEEEGDQGGDYVEGDEGYDDGEGGGGEGGYDDEENYGPTVDELIDRGQQEQLRLQVRVAMCED